MDPEPGPRVIVPREVGKAGGCRVVMWVKQAPTLPDRSLSDGAARPRRQLLKGVVTRSDGVRIGRDLIGPLAGLKPILAALGEPAIGMTHRNPAVEEI